MGKFLSGKYSQVFEVEIVCLIVFYYVSCEIEVEDIFVVNLTPCLPTIQSIHDYFSLFVHTSYFLL